MPIIITVNWAEGRSPEKKKILVESIAQKVHQMTGTEIEKIFIFFYDIPHYNAGIGGTIRG